MFAYAVGHLANDLVLQVWSSYQAWYLIKCVNLGGDNTGLVAMIGEMLDSAA